MSRVIKIEELTRVEGHGRIEIVIDGETLREVKMPLFEGPRFLEALIETVSYDKVPDIMRRICAICTASHSLASIRAIEKVFDVRITEQTELLRDLLIHGEMIESHALHLFMLALPDYLGFQDVISMASKYPKEVRAALQLKKTGNLVHKVLSGREVHGMNERIGGFSKVPSEDELSDIKKAMEVVKPTAELAVDLFRKVDIPTFTDSDNTFMALDPGKKYGYMGEHVLISDGSRHSIDDYLELTNEKTMAYSYAKHSFYKGSPFMVGALARILLNNDKLKGTARYQYNENRDLLGSRNTLMNNLAQSIELVQSVDRCIEDIDALLSVGLKDESPIEFEIIAGQGIGAVEAPRGTLYHDYTFNDEGCIHKANVVTPTAQNAANMEKDFRVSIERLIGEQDGTIVNTIELISRAYDPCISCSVHILKLKNNKGVF